MKRRVAPSEMPAGKTRQAWRPVLLAAVTLAAYSNSFQSGFPMDNKGLLLDDSRIHDLGNRFDARTILIVYRLVGQNYFLNHLPRAG
jgi:hypothetical protein